MSLALVPGGGGAISYREHVENLAKEAYRSCLRVFSVGQLDWNKEHLLTNLRKELGIDNSVHTILLDETLSDPELGNIREVYGQGRQDQLYPGSGGSFRQHPKAKRLEDGFQGDMHMAQPIAPGHRPGAIMARTLKPPGPPSGAPGPLLGGPGGEKRGPGRPRVAKEELGDTDAEGPKRPSQVPPKSKTSGPSSVQCATPNHEVPEPGVICDPCSRPTDDRQRPRKASPCTELLSCREDVSSKSSGPSGVQLATPNQKVLGTEDTQLTSPSSGDPIPAPQDSGAALLCAAQSATLNQEVLEGKSMDHLQRRMATDSSLTPRKPENRVPCGVQCATLSPDVPGATNMSPSCSILKTSSRPVRPTPVGVQYVTFTPEVPEAKTVVRQRPVSPDPGLVSDTPGGPCFSPASCATGKSDPAESDGCAVPEGRSRRNRMAKKQWREYDIMKVPKSSAPVPKSRPCAKIFDELKKELSGVDARYESLPTGLSDGSGLAGQQVSGTGLAINLGVQGQQRMKVHGSKKHGPGLARQNSLISEATASIGGPPPPPAVPEINEYIGWTVLRYWPDEVDGPWVRGLITDYHADVDEHAIVYNFEEEDESFEMFRFRDHKAGVDYRLEGLSQVFSLRGPGHTGGRGTRGTLRGRGGRSRGGRHGGGRPLSAGRSPRKDVFLPRRMPPSTETLEFILRQPLEEADVRVLMARLDERQEQLHAELELLARLEDDDQDEETLRQLWQQSLDMKEAACKLELQDLDEEEKFWASR